MILNFVIMATAITVPTATTADIAKLSPTTIPILVRRLRDFFFFLRFFGAVIRADCASAAGSGRVDGSFARGGGRDRAGCCLFWVAFWPNILPASGISLAFA